MLVIKNTIQRRIILKIKLKLPDHGLQSDEEQEELKVEPETRRNIPGNQSSMLDRVQGGGYLFDNLVYILYTKDLFGKKIEILQDLKKSLANGV